MRIPTGLFALVLAAACAIAFIGSTETARGRATDGIVYAGPKTWLPGWDGELGYGTYFRITNTFENRSITYMALTARAVDYAVGQMKRREL